MRDVFYVYEIITRRQRFEILLKIKKNCPRNVILFKTRIATVSISLYYMASCFRTFRRLKIKNIPKSDANETEQYVIVIAVCFISYRMTDNDIISIRIGTAFVNCIARTIVVWPDILFFALPYPYLET